jgi:hypothetical protein
MIHAVQPVPSAIAELNTAVVTPNFVEAMLDGRRPKG